MGSELGKSRKTRFPKTKGRWNEHINYYEHYIALIECDLIRLLSVWSRAPHIPFISLSISIPPSLHLSLSPTHTAQHIEIYRHSDQWHRITMMDVLFYYQIDDNNNNDDTDLLLLLFPVKWNSIKCIYSKCQETKHTHTDAQPCHAMPSKHSQSNNKIFWSD